MDIQVPEEVNRFILQETWHWRLIWEKEADGCSVAEGAMKAFAMWMNHEATRRIKFHMSKLDKRKEMVKDFIKQMEVTKLDKVMAAKELERVDGKVQVASLPSPN